MKKFNLKVNPSTVKSTGHKELNLFELGTLLCFETHAWQARKKLPKSITDKLTPKAKKSLITANKALIDRSHLKNINGIITEARAYVEEISNPFPIKGFHFINALKIDQATEVLDTKIFALNEEVAAFKKNYSEFIAEAESYLAADNLFNPEDYPSVNNIISKFSIDYRFFDISIPKHISDSMRDEETKRFQKLMEETRQTGILALRNGFSEIITHLTDKLSGRLDGESKRIHQVAIDNIFDFFQSFQHKNMFNDVQLENMIKDATNILNGISAEDLRTDEELITNVNKQLGAVKDEIDKSITTFKRKLSF